MGLDMGLLHNPINGVGYTVEPPGCPINPISAPEPLYGVTEPRETPKTPINPPINPIRPPAPLYGVAEPRETPRETPKGPHITGELPSMGLDMGMSPHPINVLDIGLSPPDAP